MSLDVTLLEDAKEYDCTCSHCGNQHKKIVEYAHYSATITHSLREMAKEANLYQALWHPEQLGATKAKDLIPYLEHGIFVMHSIRPYLETFNRPKNGGRWEDLLIFTERYLDACKANPETFIDVSA